MLNTVISKSPQYLSLAFLSDIHLGAKLTPTSHIIETLRQAFPFNAETASIDYLFLCGDIFDRELMLVDPQVYEIKLWIFRLLRFCAKNNIKVRSLKGTPSHDWDQPRFFELINVEGNLGCDYRYYEDLDIGFEEETGLNILYVPDEYRPTTEEIWTEVQKKMSEKGLEQVDMAIMHGMFGFQLPHIPHLNKHKEERYLEITRLMIVCGHIHQPNQYERIYIPGSADRLCHGDEGEKSHIRAKLWFDKEHRLQPEGIEVTRVPHTHAKIYRTIDCTKLELEEALLLIEDQAKSVPNHSSLRIQCPKTHPLHQNLRAIKNKFPMLDWLTHAPKDTGRPIDKLVKPIATRKVVQITEKNLPEIVEKKMEGMGSDPFTAQRALTLLRDVS